MRKKTRFLASILALATTGAMSFSGMAASGVSAQAEQTVGVTYQAQVQTKGWQKAVTNGAAAGTTGKGLRMETLKINLTGAPKAVISYQAQVQKIGWQSNAKNGGAAGTVGKKLRVEAIRISIAGLSGYSVQYRAYVQKTGWQAWKTTANGTVLSKAAYAGTVGKGLRIEAFEIKLVKPAVTVQSVKAVAVTTPAGIAPTLPTTVTATMSNATTKQVAVTWDAIAPASYATPCDITVHGTIPNTSVKAVATITVGAPIVVSVATVSNVTPAGVAPTLPATVTATMSNATTQQVAVTWDAIAPTSYATPGDIVVNGTIPNSSVKAVAAITVGAPVIVSVATVSDATTAGVAPTLPTTVMATMSNATTKSVTVTWDAIAPASYASAGTFTVNGTVQDYSSKVVATITVS